MPQVGRKDVSDSDSRLEELERLIEDELLRRLQNPADAAELPAHSLARLYDSVTKAKKPDRQEAEDEGEQDLFDLIQNTQLPEERKRELVQAEAKRLTERMERLNGIGMYE